MPSDSISFQNSGYFTPLIVDYLNEAENLKSFYNNFPKLPNFGKQIQQKKENFPVEHRQILADALLKQYDKFTLSELTNVNIEALRDQNTFTITTGHQLNLFSGPLYFLYKIISTIKLTQELKQEYPNQQFVPIFWMATEDHDFEEINHFHYKNHKISWNVAHSGPTGRISTSGLEDIVADFKSKLGISINAKFIASLFEDAYLKHTDLSNATRFITNALFGDSGLVILDADDRQLKTLFIAQMRNDLFKNEAFLQVSETIERLQSYKIQVNPREINLFYIEDDFRERIVFVDEKFNVNNTNIFFTAGELEQELQNFPEKFSPNVIMRPLYQEVILPNLCYIGGGGELAYWLELKSFFDSQNITFPMLLLRNSVLISSQKQADKLDKLQISWQEIFLPQNVLLTKHTKKISAITIDFSEQRSILRDQFKKLYQIAANTDKSFLGAVAAQQTKQLKGLETLEKRLLKAQKRKFSDELERLAQLQNELFPNGSLQERKYNFSQFYEEYGGALLSQLMQQLQPLSQEFDILILK